MADESRRRTLNLTDKQCKTEGEAIAKAATMHGMNSALLIAEYIGGLYDDKAGLTDWMRALQDKTKAIQSGDMKSVEAVLTGQALALDAIFTDMARKAILNNRMDQLELCMRLALKAQNQSRATLEALAAIKNPQQTVFMKQANIANGPQQVNNGPIGDNRNADSKAQKKNNSWKNKLLTANEKGERMVTGTADKAGGNDSEMEAVGSVNRAKNRGRKSGSVTKRL
ncbi:MAG: hypothetical protein HGB26_01235 [Desulfobulbaceae bacterium]|nr:hypothetical protein [Desulfobulbaceae bacterium]